MLKKFNVFALALLIIGQTILGPMAVSAESITPETFEDELETPAAINSADTGDKGGNLDEAFATAEEAVEKAEASQTQESIDAAKILIDALEDGEEKNILQVKLDALADALATEALEKAKESQTQEDVNVDGEEQAEETSNSEDVEEEEVETEEKQEQPEEAPVILNNTNEKSGFKLEIGKVTDFQGNEYTGDKKLNPTDEFSFNLDWHLENGHTYTDGDSIEFDLPKQVYIPEEMTERELKDEYDEIIAHYTVTTDNKIKLIFTDYVDKNSDVEGFIGIGAKLNPNEVEIVDGEVTIEPIGDGQAIVLPVNPPDNNKEVSKTGKPATDYNAEEINWTVTANGSGADLKNAKVIDNLPEGLAYKEGSLKVTKYKTNLLGEVVGEGENVTSEITPTTDGQELTIPLGDTKDKYVVEYTTEITDMTKPNFTNNVKLVDENKPDTPAGATVPINRGEPLKKNAVKGYDPVTGIIEWEIEFNYDQKSLDNETLSDTWQPAGKIALEGNVEIIEVTIDENGQATDVGPVELGTVNEITDGFEVAGITTDKAYKVKYKTKVKDRVIDGFTMENVASFGDDNKSGRSTGIGQYYGVKTAGNVNYNAKTIDWNITLNQDKRPMKNITITDTFTEGQTLKADSVHVTIGGVEYTDYTLTGEDENSFSIEFPADHETSEVVVITYKSDYDPNTVGNNPKNTADIEWIPENSTEKIKKDLTAGTNINWKNGNNHWKDGTYNPDTKKITWALIVNYRENAYEELIIKDTPVGNQKLVTDSIKVEELEIEANGNEKKVADVENPGVTATEDGFTLNLGETDKTYKVIYETSIADAEHIQESYENDVEVSDGTGKADKVSKSVGISKANEYSSKIGKEVGKTIEWKVDVNPGQHKVKGMTLTDTISDNQAYIQDTITVYEATVDGNGNAIKGDPYDADLYELVHKEDTQTFEIKWENEIERAFIVEYSTLFFANRGEAVTNDFKVTGENLKEGANQGGQKTVKIDRYESSGGSGKAGFLIIDKVDPDGKKLAGAKFELRDNETGKVLMSGVTDEEGQISFGRLRFDDYTLVETETPEGYVAATDEHTVTIDKEYHPDTAKNEYAYKVENYVPVFAIDLLKTGNNNEVLAGAEFGLFDSADATEPIATVTTDVDGKILFEDLENAGTYYVQETKAPAGYILDETKHEVTIGEKEPEPVKVSVSNTPRGAVQLTKTDVDTKEALEGVEFELQKLNEETEKYETVEPLITDENGNIKTSNALEAGDYQFVETKPLDGYRINEEPVKFKVVVNDPDSQQFTMTNEKSVGSVKLIKSDAATEEKLKGAEFKLVDSEDEVVKEGLITNDQGEIVVDNLLLGNYQLIETTAPEGYELDETPIDVEITKDLQVVEKTIGNHKITNVTVEKQWNNAGGDTTPVTVKLLPTDQTVELNEENDWKATFNDLRVYDKSGKAINYEVEELEVDGYTSTVTGDKEAGFIVTNTELTTVSGEKVWLDNLDEHPTITVELLANSTKVDEAEVNAASDWNYEFTDLVKYDESGEAITYTVDEVEVDGYETIIEDFNITNLRVGKTEVSGTKTWLDDNSKDRPESITVNLLANGDKTDKTVEVDADSDWTYEFTNLDKYDDQGTEITYTVDEADVAGYEKSIEGKDITNLRIGTTEVEISKLWKDENETDRPATITVNLLQNGTVYGTPYEITKENDWKLTIKELPQYDEKGKAYEYTITEHDVAGYEAAIDGFDVTNTRTDVKSIEISKSWLDNDSEDRPDSIEVELFRSVTDGEKELVDTITVTKEADWSLEVADLPSFDKDGKAYTYEINEKAVDGYETSVNGFDITNLRVGETAVEGTKTWLDDDSKDRPESITVNLLANGDKTDKTVEVDADSDWTYEFTNLDKYDDKGTEITYSVDEVDVPEGYKKSIEGNDITNLRVGTTEVDVTKLWKGEQETDRPKTITVNLLQNGDFYEEHEVTKENDWELTITDLPQYDEIGKAYEYTVTEHDVAGYSSEVDGFEITNTRADVKAIEITKTWLDDDSKDRPDSIEVELFRSIVDGEKELVDTITVTKEADWSLEVEDLPSFDKDGKAYTYEINEKTVDGYETSVNGFDITNLRVGTTSVEGTKSWKDDNEKDRPEMIKVDLLQNGEKIDTVEVTAETEWKYSFEDLVEFDENGVAYAYTVKEQPVAGYTPTVDGYNITNTLKPVEPTEPEEPEEPNKPIEPVNPSDPGDNGNIDKPEDAEKPGSGNEAGSGKLPQTGEEQFMYMIALGVLLLAAGGIVLFRQRRGKA